MKEVAAVGEKVRRTVRLHAFLVQPGRGCRIAGPGFRVQSFGDAAGFSHSGLMVPDCGMRQRALRVRATTMPWRPTTRPWDCLHYPD